VRSILETLPFVLALSCGLVEGSGTETGDAGASHVDATGGHRDAGRGHARDAGTRDATRAADAYVADAEAGFDAAESCDASRGPVSCASDDDCAALPAPCPVCASSGERVCGSNLCAAGVCTAVPGSCPVACALDAGTCGSPCQDADDCVPVPSCALQPCGTVCDLCPVGAGCDAASSLGQCDGVGTCAVPSPPGAMLCRNGTCRGPDDCPGGFGCAMGPDGCVSCDLAACVAGQCGTVPVTCSPPVAPCTPGSTCTPLCDQLGCPGPTTTPAAHCDPFGACVVDPVPVCHGP
jgi:hypothetical protein